MKEITELYGPYENLPGLPQEYWQVPVPEARWVGYARAYLVPGHYGWFGAWVDSYTETVWSWEGINQGAKYKDVISHLRW